MGAAHARGQDGTIEQMKILIASSAFYPENSPRSFRATELAREFSRIGHEVTVLTVFRGEEAEAYCKKWNIRLLCLPPLIFRPIRIAAGGIMNLLTRGLNRALLMLIEYPDIEFMFRFRAFLAKESGYDMLVSIAVPYPVHWGVAWGWKPALASCWVADCGDPYMGARTDSFRKLFYFKYLEKWFSRKADFISITNIRMMDNYYPEFHSKIVEIPQGFNFEESRSKLPTYQPHAVPTFAFAGTFFTSTRDPRALFEYLCGMEQPFRFLVFSAQRSLVMPYVERSKGRIVLMDLVPREQLLNELAQMDFLVNISYDEKVQSPSKLIDYYLVGRPVLSLASGAVDQDNLEAFLQGDYQKAFSFVDYERFRIERVAEKFVALYQLKASS